MFGVSDVLCIHVRTALYDSAGTCTCVNTYIVVFIVVLYPTDQLCTFVFPCSIMKCPMDLMSRCTNR